jgi:hypothetical protein
VPRSHAGVVAVDPRPGHAGGADRSGRGRVRRLVRARPRRPGAAAGLTPAGAGPVGPAPGGHRGGRARPGARRR